MTTTTHEAATPEGRLFPGHEIREVETTAGYTMMRGLAVPYKEWASIGGLFLEEFERGSLEKSINTAANRRLRKGAGLPLNLFHENRMFPIGAASEWQEESRGLFGVWRLDGSDTAQEAARLAESGMLTGLSIEFAAIQSRWAFADEFDPARGPDYMHRVTRTEARLGAVGLVQTPAYMSAGVELVRSADALERAADVLRRRAESEGTPVLDTLKARTEALRKR